MLVTDPQTFYEVNLCVKWNQYPKYSFFFSQITVAIFLKFDHVVPLSEDANGAEGMADIWQSVWF